MGIHTYIHTQARTHITHARRADGGGRSHGSERSRRDKGSSRGRDRDRDTGGAGEQQQGTTGMCVSVGVVWV